MTTVHPMFASMHHVTLVKADSQRLHLERCHLRPYALPHSKSNTIRIQNLLQVIAREGVKHGALLHGMVCKIVHVGQVPAINIAQFAF